MKNEFRYLEKEKCFNTACATCEVYRKNSHINKECPQKHLKDEYKKQCFEEMLKDIK